jgi:hypothetical protein
MGTRFRVLPITSPAGTAILTPNQTLWQLDDSILTRLEIMVPDGHNGNTGIRCLRSQQQIIPWSNSRFLIANSETVSIEYGEELTESQLLVLTYNVDIFDHTFYLRATMTDMPLLAGQGGVPPAIVPSALLTSAGVPSP